MNVARQSPDNYIFNIRPKFANLSHKCTFNETCNVIIIFDYVINFCRVIVAN